MVVDPVVEHVLQLRVQGDVAVVVQLAGWDPKSVVRADLDDRVDGEREQLTFTDPGAGQQFHDPAREWVRSARLVRMTLVAAASSRNRGRGLSMIGRSPVKISGPCGGLG